ncbi:MAG: 2-hydroxychromene-2-carboxylate isomerase [Myxococcota bacterium]
MAKGKVRFYFAYNSPYAFLGNSRIDRELAPFDLEIERKPIYGKASGGGPDLNSPRFQYLFKDIGRFADAYGLKMNPGPFADTEKACLGFFFAREKGCEEAYHHAVYSARWLEGRDIGDVGVLGDIAAGCGLDRDAFLAALDNPAYAEALAASNKDGQADGVFGFPTFLYEGEKFWGNDRIEWLVRHIKAATA